MNLRLQSFTPTLPRDETNTIGHVTVVLDCGIVIHDVQVKALAAGGYNARIHRRPCVKNGDLVRGSAGNFISRNLVTFDTEARFREFCNAVVDAVRAAHPHLFTLNHKQELSQ